MKLFSWGPRAVPSSPASATARPLPSDPELALPGLVGDLGVGMQQLREEWPSRALFLSRSGSPERYRELRERSEQHAVQAQLSVLHPLHLPQGPALSPETRSAAALKLLEATSAKAWSQTLDQLLRSDAFAPVTTARASRCRTSDSLRALASLASSGLEANPEAALRDEAEAGFSAQRLDLFRVGLNRTLYLVQVKLPRSTPGYDALVQLVGRVKTEGVQIYTDPADRTYRTARAQLEGFVQTLDSVVAGL